MITCENMFELSHEREMSFQTVVFFVVISEWSKTGQNPGGSRGLDRPLFALCLLKGRPRGHLHKWYPKGVVYFKEDLNG